MGLQVRMGAQISCSVVNQHPLNNGVTKADQSKAGPEPTRLTRRCGSSTICCRPIGASQPARPPASQPASQPAMYTCMPAWAQSLHAGFNASLSRARRPARMPARKPPIPPGWQLDQAQNLISAGPSIRHGFCDELVCEVCWLPAAVWIGNAAKRRSCQAAETQNKRASERWLRVKQNVFTQLGP